MVWRRGLLLTAPVIVAASAALGAMGLLRRPDTASVVVAAFSALVGVAILIAARAVDRRLPGNAVAAALTLMVVVVVFSPAWDAFVGSVAAQTQSSGTAPPDVIAAAIALSMGGWMWWFVPVGILLVIFPDGRAEGRLGRITLICLPVVAIAFQILGGFALPTLDAPLSGVPNPLGGADAANTAAIALVPLFFGLLVAAVVCIVLRYRRASGLVRTQLRWLRLGGIALPATLLLCWLSYLVLGSADLVSFGLLALYLGIPAVTVVALLRHQRYDVDDAAASAAAYAGMIALLLGVFSVASIGSGMLIGRESFDLAVTVTAVVALALGSAHRRIRQVAGRLLFPVRERSLRAVAALQERVATGRGEPEEILPVLADALRDPGLWLADGADPPAVTDLPPTPVVLGGVTIGHLMPGPAARWRVPRHVADSAALLIETARLRAALGAATREIEASRERILLAGYAERKRLERDLHDGAQQRLVSLGMSLRLIQRALPARTAPLAGDLDRAVAEISTTVAELRLLAQGLRPSSLDDGLHSALAHLARTSGIPLDLQVAEIDLPDQIATTAYFVVSEAVTNAIKHAGARRVAVRVRPDGEGICVTVRDDGCGGARVRPGSGLAGLTDRVSAVGGRLAVDSRSGAGTTVRAVLPCAS